MKKTPIKFKNVIAALFVLISFSTFASELPDPEVLAKQYLKDLCTLNEQNFTRKYMLTQLDAEDFIKNINKASIEANENLSDDLSDSLAIRSQVHSLVVKSYRSFKEWQHENKIDSSKIKYHSCEFELEKKHRLPYYAVKDIQVYFSCDTMNYVFSCDDFIYLKIKWIGGDFDDIHKVDKYFNTIYDDYDYADAVDTAVVSASYVEDGNYYEGTEEGYNVQVATKKQLKIQKKIDAYNRKIDVLYIKQYE